MPVDLFNLTEVLVFITAGILGGFANLVIEHRGEILFPAYIKDSNGKTTGLMLGFLGNVFVGIALALIADTDFLISFGGAFAGNWGYNKLMEKRGEVK